MASVPISYVVNVQPEQVEALAGLLAERGIFFHPKRSIVAFNEAFMDRCVAMGHHVPELARGINEFLDREGFRPRVPGDFDGWTPERTREFLDMAVQGFDWDGDRVRHAWWQDDGADWEEVTRKHSPVFGDGPAGESGSPGTAEPRADGAGVSESPGMKEPRASGAGDSENAGTAGLGNLGTDK